MAKFKVYGSNGWTALEADNVEIDACGNLVFSDEDCEIVRAINHNYWGAVERVSDDTPVTAADEPKDPLDSVVADA